MTTSISLDKNTVLDQTNNGQNVYLHYLGLTELPKNNISSPFTVDKNPSFKLYKNGRFICFSTGKQGDVFQFVAELKNLDCKKDFSEILKVIQNDLFLCCNDIAKHIAKPPAKALQGITNSNKTLKIAIEVADFTDKHLYFWETIGVHKNYLEKYKVNALAKYSFFSESKNKDLIYNTSNYLAFSYEVNGNHEVYIPNQPEKNIKKKFCNGLASADIYGLEQLPNKKVENLIICAGKKDTIVVASRGFYAVTFQSEAKNPTTEQINTLQKHCNNLLICYDNDKGGQAGTKRITKAFPKIIPIDFPSEFNDITDYFQENSKEDFQYLIDMVTLASSIAKPLAEGVASPIASVAINLQNDKQETTTIFHIVEDYLTENYDLRYNTISLDVEISKKGENNWISCNENSLWIEVKKKSINISINSLLAVLRSDFVEKYNPLVQYFESLPEWDKQTDYISAFARYLVLDENEDRKQFEYHFKKWCVRAVKCATEEAYFNKQAFILTDNGKGQNIGKSSWCRFLCPPSLDKYIAEDINSNDKDSRILLCKNFLINLDELAALSKKDINQLKSYFSKDKINDRLPYDKKNSIIPRVASFIGSTNMNTFLQDETGSVRWLCFVISSIDWTYKKKFNIDNLWSQAFALSNDTSFKADLSIEDIADNEKRNEKFQVVPPERELILEFLKKPEQGDYPEFLTATDILQYISAQTHSIRLTAVMIGRVMSGLRFNRVKHQQQYGYWVVKRR